MARRSVNVFFNGQTVADSIKLANKEMRALKVTINNSKKGSDEYVKAVNRYANLKKEIRGHRKEMNGIESTWGKMKGLAKGFILAQVAAFSAKVIVQYGVKLFGVAEKMEIMTQKARIVFGEALPAVTAAAEKNANAIGLTASQYTEAATAIGDLLVPMGFTRKEAGSISTEMVNLSGALSKWTGGQIDAKEASDILGKALLGEREQLKRFGIAINEADVKAKLAEKGLDKLTGASLQQAKAAATLELITQKSADAQAFFAEGSDSLAGKKAKLAALTTEVSEKLATVLIPVFNRLVDIAIKVAEGINWVVDGFTDLVGDGAKEAIDEKAQALANAQQKADALAKSTEALTDKEKIAANLQKKLAADALRQKQLDNAKKIAKERQKLAEKEAKELAKKAAQLEEKILLIKQESTVAQLSEEDQKIAKLAAKYDKQIQVAIELEGKGVASATSNKLDLERLKEVALEELRQQLFEEKLTKDSEREATQIAADLEAMHKREEAKRATEEEINAIIKDEFLTERQLALEELETQHSDLLRLAELHGIDTLDLELAFRKKKSDAINQLDENDRKKLIESQQKQAVILRQSFQAVGTVIGGVMDAIGAKAVKNTKLGKLLALAQIGISSAEAIAVATAKATRALPFPANLVAIATSVATVLRNIGQAKSILSSVDVPQKKKGRWTNIRGADDGLNYNAKYIGQAPTGMLDYNHPILMASTTGPILANEAGQEYFVNHSALRNPHVLNHVRAIDNIVSHRQMAAGGSTIAATTTENPTQNNQENNELAKMTYLVMQQLLQAIPNIRAIIPDQTAIDLVERLDDLTVAGGGVLR